MINKMKDLTVVNWIGDREGIFQAIVKVPAGFMSAYEIDLNCLVLIDGRKEPYNLSSLRLKEQIIG